LVAVRFTGSSVAGLAFVAATYTLSSCCSPKGTIVRHRKMSAVEYRRFDIAAIRAAGRQ
jgi:hypothetical protein